MKGKTNFTNLEISKIKQLIKEKLKSPPDKQKGIRQQIRNFGFYYSDFDSNKDGYTVADFEKLINGGKIKITSHGEKKLLKSIKLIKPAKPKIISKAITPKVSLIKDLKTNLTLFKSNRFNPKSDFERIIPDSSGNYIICLNKFSKLPSPTLKPIFSLFEDLHVIYVGIAGGSLRSRDYRQHFKGNNAGRSTLRKSLGVLLRY